MKTAPISNFNPRMLIFTPRDESTKADESHKNLFQPKLLLKQTTDLLLEAKKLSYFIPCVETSNILRVKTHTRLNKFLTGDQDQTLF